MSVGLHYTKIKALDTDIYILKTIKNATDTSVVILTYSSEIYFVYISNGPHFVQECFSKTRATFRTADQNFGKKCQFCQI